ncbi:MAG TPA: D-alanine--D-alanine ligase [Candidatus Spyradenecus faecavium]|uniref:D-alanine--D-alanine ligase n=1 Tax=Candidatus Spyradenecus faecavium TaxID=2840947 RepID=A0A9D1NLT8_9BACT|nr:D-alanine--D-alanine ligase [Candidatus Spyradenecus faecavium]
MKKRIAVAMGGTSHEAEVSLRSGAAVAAALREAGYDVVEARLTRDAIDEVPRDVDAVFIALHGGYGEGGGIQADLDAAGLPYTGPGAAASRLCMDKPATKAVLRKAGVPTPEGAVVTAAAAAFPPPFPLPVVVKPPRDGSSVGLSKVTEAGQWPEAVRLAAAQDAQGEALVERFVPGRELAVGVVGDEALPVLEIVAPNGWYDYHAKYAPGVSRHVYPPEDATTREAQRLAVLAARATGCRGAVRVDFRLSPEGALYTLEVNTAPGCTETSLLPDAAARAGIPFPALCARLIEAARHG